MNVLKEIILFEDKKQKAIFKIVHNQTIPSQEFFELHYEVIASNNEIIERSFIVLTKERFFEFTKWTINKYDVRV